ncbi:rCG38474 [Rattus norvegicus]|uniref:RCG38474 n=1 Tax=Rattus norvegicus TaxID=10116 RepID=A6KLV4_RAT|nr:rCG38474 [Rattus norvegicus]
MNICVKEIYCTQPRTFLRISFVVSLYEIRSVEATRGRLSAVLHLCPV